MNDSIPKAPMQAGAASPGIAEGADDIFARAAQRGRAEGVSHGGLVTPREAYRLFSAGAAVIVDVRTRAEWEYVGHVPGATLIEWRQMDAQQPNANFLDELRERCQPGDAILFLCRSAVRSHHAAAAAAQAGFARAYNILEGFEGPLDADGHRGTAGGWRLAGLPWRQG